MKPVTVKLGALLLGLGFGLLVRPAGASDKIVFELSGKIEPFDVVSDSYLLFWGSTEESNGACIPRMDKFSLKIPSGELPSGEIAEIEPLELEYNALPSDCPTQFTLFSEYLAVATFKPEKSGVIRARVEPRFPINLRIWILDCLLRDSSACLGAPKYDGNVVAFDALTDAVYAQRAFREAKTGVKLSLATRDVSAFYDELRQQKDVDCKQIITAVKKYPGLMDSSDSALNVYYHKSVSGSAKYCRPIEPPKPGHNALEKRGFILIPRGEVKETLTHEIGHFLDLDDRGPFGNYMHPGGATPSEFRCNFDVKQVLKMRATIDKWEEKSMSAAAPQGGGASELMERTLRAGGPNESCPQMYERLAMDWVVCKSCSSIVLPPMDKEGVAVVQKIGRLLRGYLHASEVERIRELAEKDWEELRDLVQDKPDEVKARFEQDAGGKEAFIEFRKKKIHDRYRERAAHMLGSCSLTEKPLAWKEAGRQLKLAKNPPRRGPKWIAEINCLPSSTKPIPTAPARASLLPWR